MRECTGEDCSADGMVSAADGTWHNAKGCFRVECQIFGICEKCSGENGGHACVLHADFNRDGAFFGGVEFEQTTDAIAEHVTETVVEKHYGEHEGDKPETVCKELRTHGHDDSADNQRKADDAYGRHIRLEFLESGALAEEVVAGETDDNREDGHVKDVKEHADGIHFDARVCKPKHQKRSHERGKERACHGHAHGIGHVAFGQKTHYVTRNAARAATDKHNADGQIRVKPEDFRKRKCNERHDGVLRDCAEKDVGGAFHQVAYVVHRDGKAHAEHDDAEDDGACVSMNPTEEYGDKECDYRACDNDERCICG